MSAFIDVTCKCGKRIGWYGTMGNRPACPRCEFRSPQAELDEAEAKMAEMEELMLTHPSRASHEMRRKQRVAAGLTLLQAAKQLGISGKELSDYENCRAEPSAEMCVKMAEIYGVG